MEAIPDPADQAERILAEASMEVAAEITKSHAEMILLAAVGNKANIVCGLMAKASRQGDNYVTGIMTAVGLIARNWCRILGDDANLDLTEYISEEAEAMCRYEYAHYMARETVGITTVAGADKLRVEMHDWIANFGAENFANSCLHTLGLLGELVRDVLDIRNGDYVPDGEDGDDR